MIRYALHCEACDADFEAWFASSDAYDDQAHQGLVHCPDCGSGRTAKQIMAPAVRNAVDVAPEAKLQTLARRFAEAARQHISENFDYVGDRFADEARAMYYGEVESRPIWGDTTADEARTLHDEGVPAAPLPAPFAPPRPKPLKDVN